MKLIPTLGRNAMLMAGLSLLFFSCSKDEPNLAADQALSQTELNTILENDQISGAVDNVLADVYANDNTGAKNAQQCYEGAYTDTGFTVTFNNCALNGTDNMNGTVTVVYANQGESAAFTATYTDFYVGDVKLNGTRTFTIDGNSNQSSVAFTVESNMTATYPDGSENTSSGTKTLQITFGDSLETTTIAVSGNWTVGVDGNTYSVEVTQELTGNFACSHLLSGLLKVNKNGLMVTVDFGDGECDDLADIIYPDGTKVPVSMDS